MPTDVTPYQYAALTYLSYEQDTPNWQAEFDLQEWEILLQREADNGYFGIAFVNSSTKQVVIVHRGTDEFLGFDGFNGSDLDDDLEDIAKEHIPQQFTESALPFNNDVRIAMQLHGYANYSVSYTGHSLGGVLAELSASMDNVSAVTFDSPGSLPIIKSSENATFNFNPNVDVVTYLAHPNLVNTLNHHAGRIFTVNPPFDFDAILIAPAGIPRYLTYSFQQHSSLGLLHQFDSESGQARSAIEVTGSWPEEPYGGLSYYYSVKTDERKEYWRLYYAAGISKGVLPSAIDFGTQSFAVGLQQFLDGIEMLGDYIGIQSANGDSPSIYGENSALNQAIINGERPVILDRYPLTNLAAELGITVDELKAANPNLPGQTGTDGIEYLVYIQGAKIALPDGTQKDIGQLLLEAQFGLLTQALSTSLIDDVPLSLTGETANVECPVIFNYSQMGLSQVGGADFPIPLDEGLVEWYNAYQPTICTTFDYPPDSAHTPFPIEGERELYIVRDPSATQTFRIQARPDLRVILMGVPIQGRYETTPDGYYTRTVGDYVLRGTFDPVTQIFTVGFTNKDNTEVYGIYFTDFQEGDLGITGIALNQQQNRAPDNPRMYASITGTPALIPDEQRPQTALAGMGDVSGLAVTGLMLLRTGAHVLHALRHHRHERPTGEDVIQR